MKKLLMVIEHVEGTKRPRRLVTSQGPLQMGVGVGQWAALLAPVFGLLVFWLLPFKPAVTLYVLIVGLAIVLLKLVELRQRSIETEKIVRRKLHEYYTH